MHTSQSLSSRLMQGRLYTNRIQIEPLKISDCSIGFVTRTSLSQFLHQFRRQIHLYGFPNEFGFIPKAYMAPLLLTNIRIPEGFD